MRKLQRIRGGHVFLAVMLPLLVVMAGARERDDRVVGNGWPTDREAIENGGPEQSCPGAGGDCCSANGTPGCDQVACCEAICAVDPFCCDVTWDGICADEATYNPNCDCTGCLGPCCSGGACCADDGTTGCDDKDCCECVCDIDIFCCNTSWDDVCATEACELCGDVCDCCAACECLGDLDGDMTVTFQDLTLFLDCLATGGGLGCECADCDGDSAVTFQDLVPFLDALSSGGCA